MYIYIYIYIHTQLQTEPFRPSGPRQCSADEQDDGADFYRHHGCI